MAGVVVTAALVAAVFNPLEARAQVCNLKVVTDASPNYTDIGSMIQSITSKWPTPQEKCWALFYWHHINRRQQSPMELHGIEVTDPIRQWNDYGFTMCSTICGINDSVWGAMGFPVRHWEIQLHTVPEVFYDGRWHMYDNSMSCLYTLCDGKTVAGVEDIGKTQGCPASGGKSEFGHIARYHCLNGTGKNGFLTGADCNRELYQEALCFNPNKIQNCDYITWDRGHRFILNLRAGESYCRYYRSLGDSNEYYTPNEHLGGLDPERGFKIRGNGIRTWRPDIANVAKSAHSLANMAGFQPVADPGQPMAAELRPVKPGEAGHVIFKVEGANVITGLTIKADFFRKSPADVNAIYVSTNNAIGYDTWREVYRNDRKGDDCAEVHLANAVNGSYEVLVKFELMGQADATDAVARNIEFRTVTQVNAKALPRLNIGKNIVYVGAGDQAESTVFWPDLQAGKYKPYVAEEKNIAAMAKHPYSMAVMYPAKAKEESYIIFKMDCPRDVTAITYGGRLYNKAPDSRIDLLHSFDGGKTWVKSYSLSENKAPYDVIHFETIKDVPPGVRSVLFKYLMASPIAPAGKDDKDLARNVGCGLYAVRMEANYKPADDGFKPLEVTFTWDERQEDYTLVRRSHTQLVEKVPFKYPIDVGGADHPKMESLSVRLKRAAGDSRYGYSDGKDVGGEKWVGKWLTEGKNLAEGKSYALSKPSETAWEAGDPDGKKLTDGIAYSCYGGGTAFMNGVIWNNPKDVTITVDLGEVQKVGATRIHAHGYPCFDALKGEMNDKIEVLTSNDNKAFTSQGFINQKLRWKDLPANFMWPDWERIEGHLFDLTLPKPVDARYVQFKLNSQRSLGITEVQAYDQLKYEPFDLRLALPDDEFAPATSPAK